MANIFLVTFGTGKYNKRRFVLAEQARKTNLFDSILAYGKKDLGPEYHKYVNFDDQARRPSSLGEGAIQNRKKNEYWLWKPYLIQKTLRELDDGDILMYIDAGCTINKNQIGSLRLLLDMIEGSPKEICGIAFRVEKNHPIKNFTKRDILIRFPAVDIELPQLAGGYIIFRKSENTLSVVKQWYDLCCIDSNSLLDDSPSKSGKESADFVNNRHDQALLTMCVYDSGKFVILPSELNTNKKIAPFFPSRRKDQDDTIIGRIKLRLQWLQRNIIRVLSESKN